MTVDASTGADERRPQTVRLTVAQKRWLMNTAFTERVSQNDLIVRGLILLGAPESGPSEPAHADEPEHRSRPVLEGP